MESDTFSAKNPTIVANDSKEVAHMASLEQSNDCNRPDETDNEQPDETNKTDKTNNITSTSTINETETPIEATTASQTNETVDTGKFIAEDVKQSMESTTSTPIMATITNEPVAVENHDDCQRQINELQASLDQLRAAHAQKDNMIVLIQRENAILEKEKQQFRKEMEMANKEKESTVIKFAVKEKLLLDAKKEKETVEKQLADAKKEFKNVSIRFQAVNEEKSRITYLMDEKCNELRKYQRECEKLKTDHGHLESKLKYHANKLNMEIEAKQALEKKLEEERNAPNKLEEKANEKLKMEYEAQSILLKHEIARKTDSLDNLTKEHSKTTDSLKQVQEQLSKESAEKTQLSLELMRLQEEHNTVQNSYSEEMLNSAKLRGQLEELQVLKTQNAFNEEKISELLTELNAAQQKLDENSQDLQRLHAREQELLTINREISESIVRLQNDACLEAAKSQGTAAENALLKREKASYDARYEALETELQQQSEQRNEERLLLTRHLSEKTKLYEMVKQKLDNMLGDFEATQHKHATVVKELQRELQKYKKSADKQTSSNICSHCHSVQSDLTMSDNTSAGLAPATATSADSMSENGSMNRRSHSRSSLHSGGGHHSETSESETVASNATAVHGDLSGPSKKHLVERILRLQQATARQTEKIDFLENHTLSLVAELQKKSKVVQYYMLRDQEGALTSSKSDQHKTELAKYGNGVMSAIYNGVKGGETKGMTLELSLEINKKLQAVLEDTLLKNITLKENLAVLGMEVDTLSKRVRQLQTNPKTE